MNNWQAIDAQIRQHVIVSPNEVSNIRHTKSQHFDVSRLIL